MFEQFKERLIVENNAIEKTNDRFSTVIFTTNDPDRQEMLTVSVSKDMGSEDEVITVRALWNAENPMKYLPKCNAYNAQSCGITTFVSKSNVCASVTVENPTDDQLEAKIGEVMVVSTYLRRE